jgi:hypothetical protein
MSTSVFDQAWQRERPARAFEDLFDPASRRQLAERGIRPGCAVWRSVPRTGGIVTTRPSTPCSTT